MTRTSILRSTSAATILVGAVAIGGIAIGGTVAIGTLVMAGQAGSVLNLFATNSAAPLSIALKSEADIKESGLLTGASSGDNNFAQNASTDGGVSPPASMNLLTMETWLNRELKAANNKHFR